MSVAFGIIIVAFGIFLTTAVVGVWLFVKVARGIGRMLVGGQVTSPRVTISGVLCRAPRCRAIIPAVARYCPRCGRWKYT